MFSLGVPESFSESPPGSLPTKGRELANSLGEILARYISAEPLRSSSPMNVQPLRVLYLASAQGVPGFVVAGPSISWWVLLLVVLAVVA